MSIFTWIGQALGLIPQAIEAGKQIADAVKPQPKIDPGNSLLWHTVTYQNHWAGRCSVCGRTILVGDANQLCSEAVRRRNAGLT